MEGTNVFPAAQLKGPVLAWSAVLLRWGKSQAARFAVEESLKKGRSRPVIGARTQPSLVESCEMLANETAVLINMP